MRVVKPFVRQLLVPIFVIFVTVEAVASTSHVDSQVRFGLASEGQHHPYGFWNSPISAEWIVSQGNPVEDVFADKITGTTYYTERTSGGQNVIRDLVTHEPIFEGPWNARTRVHEYGGGQNIAYNGTVYFSNLLDDRVYAVRRGETPQPVTPVNPQWRWADFDVHPQYLRFVVAVLEDHTLNRPSPISTRGCVDNRVAIIDTQTRRTRMTKFGGSTRSTVDCVGPWRPDFWDTPRFSPDGKHLVVRQWYHPYMSWEASEIWLANIEVAEEDGDIMLVATGARRIAGNRHEVAVGEPNWVDSNTLIFTSDVHGYINPWLYNMSARGARPLAASPIQGDFGEPAFWLAHSNSAVLDEDHVIYSAFRGGRSQFYVFRLSDGTYKDLYTPYAYATRVRRVASGKIIFTGKTDTSSSSVVEMIVHINGTLSYRQIASPTIPFGYISLPMPFTLQHPRTGEPIHATYYPPTNPQYAGGLPGELPPVVVNIHGGPTHLAAQGLSMETQLFTTRGFAWLDVNYGGSMMYGRAYRERLLGKWGVVDVEDPIIAVKQLGERRLLDASRAVIRGGSAGGFTVFAALANHPGAFAAGMSMFGVSDLRTLQSVLHKFESHYLLKYVGGTPETDPELWWDRSPISKAANITSPLLILQGAEDPVVPVDQAITMFETIRKHGGHASLRIFEGEGHGWRQTQTIREALERELGWYQSVFNGTLH